MRTEAWVVVSKCPWASEVAQQVKAFAAKSDAQDPHSWREPISAHCHLTHSHTPPHTLN